MSAHPAISVVIPVKNEAHGIAACLRGILEQTVPVEEIVVIDSGSTDGTQAIARAFAKVRLIEIPPSEFNHGDTRNLGVREARGEFVIMTVGDARPMDGNWIARLLEGFADSDVVAVCGSQVVPQSADTNPVEWFRPVSKPVIRVFRFGSKAAFEAAGPAQRNSATAWDDVTAIYRRAYLLQHPFRRVTYGEDMFFALDALTSGHALAYNPAARVYHFHYESYQTVLKRTIAAATLRYQVAGYSTPPYRRLHALVRGIVRLLREPGLGLRERIAWLRYNVRIARALKDGLDAFHNAEAEGGDALQSLYERHCGTPPMPLKRAS